VLKRYLARAPQFFALFVGLAVWPAACAPHNPPATQPAAPAGAAAPQAPPASAPAPAAKPSPAQPVLPDRLSDEDFWKLSSQFSEPDG